MVPEFCLARVVAPLCYTPPLPSVYASTQSQLDRFITLDAQSNRIIQMRKVFMIPATIYLNDIIFLSIKSLS